MILTNLLICIFLSGIAASKQKIDKVLVIGLDGFGGNYAKNASEFAPHLHAVFKKSLVSFDMRAQFPSVSAPNWAALLTGMSATESGIQDNGWNHTNHSAPICPVSGCYNHLESFLDVAHSQNAAVTGLIASAWDFIDGFALNRTFINNPICGEVDDDCVEAHVIEGLRAKNVPQLIFSVFESIDHAGHGSYWGSPQYYAAVAATDARFARILQYVDQRTLVVITADHGGFGDGHGDFTKSDLESFVAYYVKDSHSLITAELQFAGSNTKVAPTILKALGYRPGHFMTAEPLALFHPDPAYAEMQIA